MTLDDVLEEHEIRVVQDELELAAEIASDRRLKAAARVFVKSVRAFAAGKAPLDPEDSLRVRVASHLLVEEAVKKHAGQCWR